MLIMPHFVQVTAQDAVYSTTVDVLNVASRRIGLIPKSETNIRTLVQAALLDPKHENHLVCYAGIITLLKQYQSSMAHTFRWWVKAQGSQLAP